MPIKAAALLTQNIVVEIEEKNQKTADDLTIAVNDLQKVSSSSEKTETNGKPACLSY